MKKQTRARELALQFIYQADLRNERTTEGLTEFLRGEEKNGEIVRIAKRMVKGTLKHIDVVDKAIEAVAINWEMNRMAVIARNVLRIGTYELLLCDDIPPKVAINEAIEMGKRYSTANSGAFINGILDKIMSGANSDAQEEDGMDASADDGLPATDHGEAHAEAIDDAQEPATKPAEETAEEAAEEREK